MSVNGAADQPPMCSEPLSATIAGLYSALGIVAGLFREGWDG